MKKLASAGISLFFFFISLPPIGAQELSVNANKEISSGPEIADTTHGVQYLNDVNGKVLRSFYKLFGEKPGVVWSKTVENGFVACFPENNKKTRVYLAPSGTLQYTIYDYAGKGLPKDIRRIVKSNFYDDSITQVSEVHKEDAVWYFVKLMDQTSIKTIRVMAGEWEVIEEIKKQKDKDF